jgi:hypothetical protein
LPGMMVHASNPSTHESEEEGSRVWNQPGLHSQTLFLKNFFWFSNST